MDRCTHRRSFFERLNNGARRTSCHGRRNDVVTPRPVRETAALKRCRFSYCVSLSSNRLRYFCFAFVDPLAGAGVNRPKPS